MVSARQNGFTIIEVLMFLAISGLLLLGAILGVSGTINNSRFNDAVNTTTSYLQGQYAAVASGRNSRDQAVNCVDGNTSSGTSTAGMTNCVVLGRLIQFTIGGNTVESRYLVGRDVSDDNIIAAPGVSLDTTAVRASNPKTISGSGLDDTFEVPWSVQINQVGSSATAAYYVAIIRSPVTERVLFYSFGGATGVDSLTASHISDSNLNQPVNICLREDGGVIPRVGYVRIGEGQGQDVIRADLTSTSGACS